MSPENGIRLGILVPSSNTALEPLTTAIVSTLPNVTVHFARFPVTEISLSDEALAQFDDSKIVEAAIMLSHANVDMIGWSGTSAGWLGLEADYRLCQRIEEATGIKATTSVIGLVKSLQLTQIRHPETRFGLVTPYLDEVQRRVIQTFNDYGFLVAAESHLNRKMNVEFADITEAELDKQMDDVVKQLGPAAKIVSTFCTNLRAAQRAAHWEKKYEQLIVVDTVSTVLWDMLQNLDVDMEPLLGWGGLFDTAGLKNEPCKPSTTE